MPDPTAPAPLRPHQEWHRLLPGLDDCLRVASEADLGAAGDAERVEVHTAEIRQLLRDYDALRAAQRARLP